VKYLSGTPLEFRLLASPTNISLHWKGLPGTNALAYYEESYLTAIKSFITFPPGGHFLRSLKNANDFTRVIKSDPESQSDYDVDYYDNLD
jgi:hypothetical protein